MKRENGTVEIEATDVVIGTFIFEDKVDTLICNNQFLTNLQAPNVKNIIVNDHYMLHYITAPNALTIDCNNCSGLMKINAPNCINLKCENTPLLFLDKVIVAKDCEILSGGELKFKSEKYAYIETKDGWKKDLTHYITNEKGLLNGEKNEYAVLRADFWHYKAKLFTTAEIVLCNENDIISIEAPNARYINCENCKILKEVNAPNCTHIYCKGSDKLNLYNMKIFPTCKVRELDEIGVFIGQAENIKKDSKEYLRIYKVVDRDKNEKIDEIETRYFFTKEEAEYYAKIKNVSVGNSNVVQIWEAEKSAFTHDMYQEEFHSLEELFDRHSENFDLTREEVIKYNEGKDITGAVVVEWNWEKYSGYCRNLTDIGIAGEGNFYSLKKESNLITGNEEDTWHKNYSLLLTKEKIKEFSEIYKKEDSLKEVLYEKLYDSGWQWNDFGHNPNSKQIRDKICKLGIELKGIFAFIEKENGEKVDISNQIKSQSKNWELLINGKNYEGRLITNVFHIQCDSNLFSEIKASEARSIRCEDCPNLEEIAAPNCVELLCEGSPLLKEENIEVAYDCEIEGLEKKKQLKM